MKTALARLSLAAMACAALAACTTAPTPVATPVVAKPVVTVQTRFFQQAEVDEAANAYAQAYALAVRESLAAGKYIEPLAYRQANAESCLSSRAYRLLGRELTAEDKLTVLRSAVSDAQIQAYQRLSQGYYVRANGLEMFSCDHAGLKIASSAGR